MKFSEYQTFIKETLIYPHQGDNLAYPALGLTGEAGEVADKIKKIIRDNDGILDDVRKKILYKSWAMSFGI